MAASRIFDALVALRVFNRATAFFGEPAKCVDVVEVKGAFKALIAKP